MVTDYLTAKASTTGPTLFVNMLIEALKIIDSTCDLYCILTLVRMKVYIRAANEDAWDSDSVVC